MELFYGKDPVASKAEIFHPASVRGENIMAHLDLSGIELAFMYG
jgi:hypothetical protein